MLYKIIIIITDFCFSVKHVKYKVVKQSETLSHKQTKSKKKKTPWMVCEEYGNKPSAERKRSIHSVIDYQPDEFRLSAETIS